MREDDTSIFERSMNVERYIANRISGQGQRNFSALIIRIAIAAVALSIVVMIVTTSVITGFKSEISSKVFSFWGHIHVTDGNVGRTYERIPIDKDTVLFHKLESIDQITYQRPPSLYEGVEVPDEPLTSYAGVDRVEPFTIAPAILSTKKDFEAILLKGLDENYIFDPSFLRKGTFVQYSDSTASRDIVLSEQTANRLRVDVGDRLILNFILDGDQPIKRRFSLSGIYRTGLEEYDRRFGLVDARILQEVLGWRSDQVSGLEIYVDDLRDMDLLNEYIYFEHLPGNLYSETIRKRFYEIFEWLELQNINERVIILLMIIVAIINMITAMMIFVLERTQMIGILKAMGATDWTVRRIFLYNAFNVILKGLLIGNALAFAICLIQRHFGLLKLSEKDYYLSTVPIEFNWWAILLINVGTIVVTLLFLILPSVIISRISPSRAVRFG